MLSKSRIAGAGALLAAPILVIAGALVRPTMSDDAANQVAALTAHRGAMIAGHAMNTIAIVLLTAGIVWLAVELAPRARNLAIAGGVLGVFGSLIVVFLNGVGAAAPAIVRGLNPVQATATLHGIQTSAAIAGLEPLQLLGDIGVALLGLAVAKVGAARWASAAIAIGALGEGAGFGTRSKALVIVAFAVMFVGLVEAVRALAAGHGDRVAARLPAEALVAS